MAIHGKTGPSNLLAVDPVATFAEYAVVVVVVRDVWYKSFTFPLHPSLFVEM